MTFKEKAAYSFSIGVILAGILMVLHFAWIMFYPYNPVTFKKMELDKYEYVPGEALQLRVELCKHLPYEGEITFQIKTNEIPYASQTLITYKTQGPAEDCREFVDTTAILPPMITDGEYILGVNASYKVKHMRVIDYFFEVGPFTVKK